MLTIETYLTADRYGGLGAFSRNFVKKDTVVWSYNPKADIFYPMQDYLLLPQDKQALIAKHVYPTVFDGVQGVMYSLDNDRYTNHSYTPNVGRKEGSSAEALAAFDAKNDDVCALKNIAPGEELTANYFHFLPDGFPDFYSDKIPLLKFLLAEREAGKN